MEDIDKNRDQLRLQFIEEIRNDEKFEHFFKDYTPSSVNSFVSLYALKKAMWTIYGPTFKNELEKMETRWVNAAVKRLAEIQQVKLFLFQCRYRAGIIEEPVKEVRTIFDFIYWGQNVLNAGFLEPVTEYDVELYCKYMKENDGNHQPMGFLEDWQDFDAIREAYNNEEETDRIVPEWYQFYFEHTGHGTELTLPDHKVEKDIFYFKKGNQERIRLLQEEEKKAVAENPALAPEKGRYFNEFTDNLLVNFMNLFEDKPNREMHEVYLAWTQFTEKEERLRDDLDILMYADENIPTEENENWQEALLIAAARYSSKKIEESLPAAFELYKMKLALGITFPEKEGSRSQADVYNNLALLGRKMMGEPEDFDY